MLKLLSHDIYELSVLGMQSTKIRYLQGVFNRTVNYVLLRPIRGMRPPEMYLTLAPRELAAAPSVQLFPLEALLDVVPDALVLLGFFPHSFQVRGEVQDLLGHTLSLNLEVVSVS
jgi:hypothetical protein